MAVEVVALGTSDQRLIRVNGVNHPVPDNRSDHDAAAAPSRDGARPDARSNSTRSMTCR